MVRAMSEGERPGSRTRTRTWAGCRPQRAVGVGLWAGRPCGWEQGVPIARCVATVTHLRLAAALEERQGEEAPRGGEHGKLRLRFLARRDDGHVTGEAIREPLTQLCAWRWSALTKLEEFDGVPSFAQLPALS